MKEIYNLTGKTTEEASKIIDEAIKQCRGEVLKRLCLQSQICSTKKIMKQKFL